MPVSATLPQPFEAPRAFPSPRPAVHVRLARSRADLLGAQQLRYRVFYEEMGAVPGPAVAAWRRDYDAYDAICDHLIAVAEEGGQERIVGTCRLLGHDMALRHQGFYSQGEFDLSGVLTLGRWMEVGRSCIDPAHRGNGVIQKLWSAIARHAMASGVGGLFGCASLPGTDANALRLSLSHLYHHHRAPAEWRITARGERAEYELLPRGEIDPKAAWRSLPPLLKAYLRLGGLVGAEAVIDRQFNTTDVFIAVPFSALHPRYRRHFMPA